MGKSLCDPEFMIHPLLYELNTRCWLCALSDQAGRGITLANVPDSEFERWQQLGFTHIWAMGVWITGPRSRAMALADPLLRKSLDEILPGWREEDVPGSPYAIANYEVPSALGGEAGLKAFRKKLNDHGLKLLLDFVPNHLGLDHIWVTTRPDVFVQSPVEVPGTFPQQTSAGPRWLAHGKDPHFQPWTDTVQLDYRRPETRAAMLGLLQSIALRCDGVRCDMAMLILNDVFAKTWVNFPVADPAPRSEFWANAIPTVKNATPGFLFLAEVYWNLQPQLQALGFDYTYDKYIYDRLLDRRYADLQRRLFEFSPAELAASAHFLENHDEHRIASVLTPAEHRAAATLMLCLPGMRFLYEGQLQGWRLKVPVQLGRWPAEPSNPEIVALYEKLLATLKDSAVGQGDWQLLRPIGWPDNPTAENMVIIQWLKSPEQFELAVLNLSARPSQCRVQFSIKELAAHDWEMRDLLGTEVYERHGPGLVASGLYFDLPGNAAQLFRFVVKA
ncbi:MAG: alpha amylase catalytic region [Pedosphaera sp.]|nr:alpha amylase catalytic region [Pedosphaera sp.]